MKKCNIHIIFLILILIERSGLGQISLEHTYDSASINPTDMNQLILVDLEVSGNRYVKIDRGNKQIKIFNLNHELIKTISYWSFPNSSSNFIDFLYFSENLFDLDSEIEFMYFESFDPNNTFLGIYNEDGSLVFSVENQTPQVRLNIPITQMPIYNTSNGTKMIFNCSNCHHAYVYALPGSLSTKIEKLNNNYISSKSAFKVFPNPSNNYTVIYLNKPENINKGLLEIYDFNGSLVYGFVIEKYINSYIIDNTKFHSGVYFYKLKSENGEIVEISKNIIIK